MATARKTPAAAAAAVLLLLIAVAAVAPVSGSNLTIYPIPGCQAGIRGRCGVCYNIGPRTFQGFHFNYSGGQVARLYRELFCRGRNFTVARNTKICDPRYPYRSIRMSCLQ